MSAPSPLPDLTEPAAAHRAYVAGLGALRGGRHAEAIAHLAPFAAAHPDHRRARFYLAWAQVGGGTPEAALPLLAPLADPVSASPAERADALFLTGSACNAIGRPADAARALRGARSLRPGHAETHLNLGNALADLDDLDGAEAAMRVAVTLDPALAAAHASLGYVLTRQGRLEEGIAACERAVAADPDLVQAIWNLGIACLLAGDWARGWSAYEARKRHPKHASDFRRLPGPVWQGEDIAGRTILVLAEQGLGDTVQFARYLILLASRGARVRLACDRSLVRLMNTLPGICALPRDARLPDYDCWADQMSLPGLFATRPDTVPLAEGYLAAAPDRAAAWQQTLPPGPRIGLVWAGNPAHSNDRHRSLTPPALAALVACRPAGWVGLQVGPRHAEAPIPDFSARLTDYAETAAAITCLDLLVTVDTSVAHVAGALGVPCIVMLPHAPDWRWLAGRDDTPWFRSLRLVRQPAPGDWASVIEKVAVLLP